MRLAQAWALCSNRSCQKYGCHTSVVSMSLAIERLSFTIYWSLNCRKSILHAWKDPLIFAKLVHYLFIAPYDQVDKAKAINLKEAIDRYWFLNNSLATYLLCYTCCIPRMIFFRCYWTPVWPTPFSGKILQKYKRMTTHTGPKHHVQNGGTSIEHFRDVIISSQSPKINTTDFTAVYVALYGR